VVWIIAFVAGVLGSLTGLGGGVIIVPSIVLALGVDIRYAIGASLVSVIATSSGAAAAYVREGYANIRVGMFLEIATTVGAISGAFVAGHVSTRLISVVFGAVLLFSAYFSKREHAAGSEIARANGLAARLRMDSTYPTPQGPQPYQVQSLTGGFGLMYVAGILSGLLGIGSGAMKVLAMDQCMRLPFKVSATTSNFMIGVTAAASAGVYLSRGYIDPGLTIPVMLGVLSGAMLGARFLMRAHVQSLRWVFIGVVVVMAAEMIYRGVIGGI
jgi:hypothetical protein